MRLYTIRHKQSGQIVAMIEAATAHQAYSRLCQSDYEISVTRAIDVSAHLRNNGRVISGNDEDAASAAAGLKALEVILGDLAPSQKPLEPEFAQLLTANMRELTRND